MALYMFSQARGKRAGKVWSFMQVLTYQSKLVLNTLRTGKTFRAEKSLSYTRAYDCLIDMLGLECKCPVFGCLKYRRKCSDGRGASSVLFELDVPRQNVWLTEYAVWADFIYSLQYTNPTNYKRVGREVTSELTQQKLDFLIYSLKKQKGTFSYAVPQVILEEIRPDWVKRYQIGNGQKQRL